MEPYGGLSQVYDYLLSGVDFEGWADYVEKILHHFDFRPVQVLDLACGTGNTILPMAARGYQSKGVDISPQMIERAKDKAAKISAAVEFEVGDMRSFILDKPVDLVTCFHDGLNYMIDSADLLKVFTCTARNLAKGGLFIFDLNAVQWVEASAQGPVVIEQDTMTLIYNTAYEKESAIWSVELTCFLKEGELFRKCKEQHQERGYDPHAIQVMLTEAGFLPLAVYDAFTFQPPHETSKRHFYVARR